jgi:hypothetical protein
MPNYSVINRGAMVNGQPEDISIPLSNFDALAAIINQLDDANIAPGANIQLSKLAPGGGSTGGVTLTGGTVTAQGDLYTQMGQPQQVSVGNIGGNAGIEFGGDTTLTRTSPSVLTLAGTLIASSLTCQSDLWVGAGTHTVRALFERGAALTIDGSGSITVTNSFHKIASGGLNILQAINGNPVMQDGQFLILWNGSGGTISIQTGGNINTSPSPEPWAVNIGKAFIWDTTTNKWLSLW